MTRIICAACKHPIEHGRIAPRPFLQWGWVAALALSCILAFGAGRASAQVHEGPPPTGPIVINNRGWMSEESLDAFAWQIASQGLALKMAQADRCVRRYRFAALTVHDGCLYEVSDFRGAFPQFELCRDARGEPVCGGRR